MDGIKMGSRGMCICGQLDYGGHEHCREAWELLETYKTWGCLWTLTSILDPNWRCWTIIGESRDDCYNKCVRDFPGRTKEQWEIYLVPIKVKLEDIPEEYQPKLPWSKPWIKK